MSWWFQPLLPAAAQLLAGGAEAQASGTLALAGTAAGVAPASGMATGDLALGGSAAGQAPAKGQGAGALGLDGTAEAEAPAKGQGAGTLGLDGTAEAKAPAKGQASGALGLDGTATAVGASPVDYSTGRLAFAAQDPRAGTLLNTRSGRGRMLNRPRPPGLIMNDHPRAGTIMNPVRRGKIMEIA